ncbi:MAG: hydrolase [Gemmatimonadetes bacterium]|nr:hydrolase [Gemmatimonadota bacterium]
MYELKLLRFSAHHPAVGQSASVETLTGAMKGRLILMPGVGALIRDEDGRELLERRSDGGDWGLPAGGVDPGETPAEAIRREVRGETGLEVRVAGVAGVVGVAGVFGGAGFRHTYPDGREVEAFTVVFDCERTGGELHNTDGEVERLRYVAPDRQPVLMMPYPPTLFARDRGAPVLG